MSEMTNKLNTDEMEKVVGGTIRKKRTLKDMIELHRRKTHFPGIHIDHTLRKPGRHDALA